MVYTLPLTFARYTKFERTLAPDVGNTPIGPWLLGIDVGAFIDYHDVFEVKRYKKRRKGEVISRKETDFQTKSHTNHSIVIPAWKVDEALDIEGFVIGRRKAHEAREKLLAQSQSLLTVEKDADAIARQGVEDVLNEKG